MREQLLCTNLAPLPRTTEGTVFFGAVVSVRKTEVARQKEWPLGYSVYRATSAVAGAPEQSVYRAALAVASALWI